MEQVCRKPGQTGGHAAGQRRDFRGIGVGEGRLDEGVFAGLLENLDLQFAGPVPGLVSDLHLIAYPPQIGRIAQRHGVDIGIIRQNDLFDGPSRETLRQIDLGTLVLDLARPVVLCCLPDRVEHIGKVFGRYRYLKARRPRCAT